jgi:ribosome-associated protein
VSESDELAPEGDRNRRRIEGRIQDIVDVLLAVADEDIDRLPLDDELRRTLHEIYTIREKGARKRHRGWAAKLMRSRDVEELRKAVAFIEKLDKHKAAEKRQMERWRDRLIEEGAPAFDAVVKQYPRVDRQRLSQLVTQARKSGPNHRSRRELLDLLLALPTG